MSATVFLKGSRLRLGKRRHPWVYRSSVSRIEGEYENGKRLLRVNGAGEVPTDIDSIRTFRLLGNLPLLLHSGTPAEVLVIAFGGGITLGVNIPAAPVEITVSTSSRNDVLVYFTAGYTF